ncbi:MAG: methyltransferase domain-containing protein [Pseudomonadota bacterium]
MSLFDALVHLATGAPGAPHRRGDTAIAHRARLLGKLKGAAPDAADALNLIRREIDALPVQADRNHLGTHLVRYLQTYLMVPQGPDDRSGRVVDIGGPSLHNAPLTELKRWQIETVAILSIDYERDPLPFADQSCDGVLLCEVIEHFVLDPLHCFHEINRVLKPGGFLVVTTPNAASWFAIYQALAQNHPSRWPVYSGDQTKARNHIHAREYLVTDLGALLDAAGFEVTGVKTRDYGIAPAYRPLPGFLTMHRGETIFVRARKVGPPKKRFAPPLYVEDVAADAP